MLVDKNKWRQSEANEIKLRNGWGRRVNFPVLLNYRLLFGENGSKKKNVSWIKVMKGLEGQSRAICYYLRYNICLTDLSIQILGIIPAFGWSFKEKKIRNITLGQRSRNIWIWRWNFFFPKGRSLTTIPWGLKKGHSEENKLLNNVTKSDGF